jgi:hypothetical protein
MAHDYRPRLRSRRRDVGVQRHDVPQPVSIVAAPSIRRSALRGRVRPEGFAGKHPADALRQVAGHDVKELELASVIGEPYYVVKLSGRETRMIPVTGAPQSTIAHQQIVDAVRKAALPAELLELSVLEQPDLYYVSRWNYRPLPVILARVDDAERTRYYIDPKTATVVTTYGPRNWQSRWLYHGMHSLDFPVLYAYRPLWDIVVITFMVGGTALCVTSLILAWRVMGRTLARAVNEHKITKQAIRAAGCSTTAAPSSYARPTRTSSRARSASMRPSRPSNSTSSMRGPASCGRPSTRSTRKPSG